MPHVLLVEDNVKLLENLRDTLEMHSYKVDGITDGQQAIHFLNTTHTLPDIIVSDISMPKVNGYELLVTCQRHLEWSMIPFIFLTALGERNDILAGIKLGADDYLVKPFRADELIIFIENKLRRINQIKADAESKLDASRRELLTIISHELRTPLSSIYGGAELLADSLINIPDPMPHRMLNLVQSGAKRMRRLVEQIVLLMQLDSQGLAQSLQKNLRPYNMQIIIERAYSLLEEEWDLDKPLVRFNFYMPVSPIMVNGHSDFLVMMVGEGLRNATTFSPQNGQVNIDLTHDNQYALIIITDQGQGISADDLPHVWERFVQINRHQLEQQGMGLGLALTRESARLHNGDCVLESVIGIGTRFILKLPLAELQNAD